MAKRGDNKAAKQRRQERERQRRQATANREPGPEAFGIKLPPPAAPGYPAQRPDFTETDWDALQAAYPRDAQRVKRAMYIGFVGERAKRAQRVHGVGLEAQSRSPPKPVRS